MDKRLNVKLKFKNDCPKYSKLINTMDEKDSIFIKLLKYGEQVNIKGTYPAEAKKWAYNNDLANTEDELELFRELFEECFKPDSSNTHFVLKSKYYFRLIEYRELQEARKTAKQANRNSLWAIGIALISVIITLVFAFRPIDINQKQVDQIIQSIPLKNQCGEYHQSTNKSQDER